MHGIKGIITDISSTVCDKGTVVPLIAMKIAWKDFGVDACYDTLNFGSGFSKGEHLRITQRLLNNPKAYNVKMDRLLEKVEYNTMEILKEEKFHSLLFDNLGEQFKALQSKGVKIGHTTSYTSPMTKPILKCWKEMYNYIPDAVITRDELAKKRPYSDEIIKCSERLLVPLKNCITINESEEGILAGNNLNIPSFGVYQYGNWRGPFEAQFDEDMISESTYYDKIYKGITEEYAKMKSITNYAYPSTSKILILLEKNMLIDFNKHYNKKLDNMEIYRHLNRYKSMITYRLRETLLIITAHKILTYRLGGNKGSNDFFIDPEGGPFIYKGYSFEAKGKKYTVTNVVDFEQSISEGDDPLNSNYDYDLTITCKYTSEDIKKEEIN